MIVIIDIILIAINIKLAAEIRLGGEGRESELPTNKFALPLTRILVELRPTKRRLDQTTRSLNCLSAAPNDCLSVC